MNCRSGFTRLLAKVLVFLMVIQGMPLGQLSKAYVWEPDAEKITRIIEFLSFGVSEANAASITPGSYTSSLAEGQSITVQRTVTIDSSGPAANLVDVFFLADNTGSMGGAIRTVRDNAQLILDALAGADSRFAGIDVAFGVGYYRGDPREFGSASDAATRAYGLQQPITASISDVRAAIDGWRASGGGDGPEANFFALHQVASSGGPTDGVGSTDRGFETGYDTGWRPNAARVIVWFGDYRSHTTSVDLDEVIKALTQNNVTVAAINTRAESSGINAYSQASDIAEATDGTLTNRVSGTDRTIDAILNAVEAATATVDLTLQTSGDTSGLTIGFSCASPEGCEDVLPGESRIFDMTITGDTLGTYEYEVVAPRITGAVAQDTTLVRSCINDLSVRGKGTKAQLVWTDTGADHYVVYRSLTAGGPYEQVAETRSRYSTYLDYGLTLGTTYYYIVREADATGVEYCQTVEASVLARGRTDRRPPNEPPAITSAAVTDATQGVLYGYDVEAVDPNAADVLTYSLDISPSAMTIDAATGLIEWTPENFHVGSHSVVVRVEDPAGLIDTQLFTVTVANVNDAPAIISSPITTVLANEDYIYTIGAIDPDVGDTLTYSLLVAPAGMVLDPALAQLQWTPDASQVGTHDVHVEVTDSGGLSAAQLFSITVIEVNRTPSITSSPVTAVYLGSDYVYDAEATDPNSGDTLAFSLLVAPAGMTIEDNTGLIEWTPLDTQLGTHSVEVQVEDSGGLTDTQSFSVEVALPDVPPEITSAAITSASEGVEYLYDVEATDPNAGATLTYGLDTAPAGMSIDAASGLIRWTPAEDQVGDHDVTVRVTDDTALFVLQTYVLSVANTPDAPAITSTPVVSAIYAVVYSYDVDAVDPDVGDTLTYSLLTAPSGMTIDAASGAIEWTPLLTQMGANSVEVQVADADGLTATQSFVIDAVLPELAPVIDSTPITTATEGVLYGYDVDASDLNGDTLTYSLDTAAAGMSIDPVSGLIQWTPTEAQVGTADVVVRVTDSTGLFVTQSFSIDVDNVLDPPTITSVPVTTATVEIAYSYDVEATDSDVGETLTYSLDAAPTGMSIDAASGLVEWTPTVDQDGTHGVIVRVADSGGLFVTQSFDIVVEQTPNDPPEFTSTPVTTADVGTLYSYSATATDPEGDSMTFSLDTAPDGMVIDSATGLVEWGPTPAQLGTQAVTIRVTDANGLFATQSFTIEVFSPPTAAYSYSGVLTRLETISFDGSSSTDPDGGAISSYEWDFGDGTSDSGASVTHAFSSAGSFVVTLTVTDDEGASSSVSLTLDIAEIMVVAPDVVGLAQSAAESAVVAAELTVGTITTANSATVPTGHVISQLPTAGTSVVISSPVDLVVSIGPVMVVVPDVTGMPQTDASAAISSAGLALGTVTPMMDFSVPEGQVLAQSPAAGVSVPMDSIVDITVAVHDDTVLPQVSVHLSANPVLPGRYTQITVSATDNVGVETVSLTVDGVSVPLDGNNQALYQTGSEGTLVVTGLAEDAAGNTGSASVDLVVSTAGDDTPPTVSLSYTPSSPAVGDTIDFSISATDDSGVDLDRIWLNVDGTYVPVADGLASYVANRQGSIPAVASAYDLSGNYAEDVALIPVTISGDDTEPPSVSITSPVEDDEIVGSVDVVGTADDANFAYYTLSHRAQEASEYVEYYRSEVSVTDGILGPFDGTILENGFYSIRLTVVDQYGNASVDDVDVMVSGEQKLGNFTLAFQDMSINLSGINLEVMRTYDSRVKTKRDFGIGWSLEVKQSMNLHEDVVPGVGYETYCTRSLFGSCLEWGVRAAQDHKITIQIPGVRKQEFEIRVTSTYARPGGTAQGYITCEPMDGTYTTLEPLNSTSFEFLMGGDLLDFDFNVINPNLYRLTLLDGTEYYYNQDTGAVYRLVDSNDNSVDISDSGIVHSAGAEIDFVRDGLGRITSIEDSDGRTVTYAYDGLGNLKSVTDANGNVTQFKYAVDHYLDEVIDSRGIRAVRTEYDEDGRLVREINVEGDERLYAYDTDSNETTVSDFAGNTTTYLYDDNGNVTSKTDNEGNTWTYAYDARNNLLETINPDGTSASAAYDARDKKISETDELGNTIFFSYNSMGLATSTTDALGRVTEYEYDARGNPIRTIGPDLAVLSEQTYDSQGKMLTRTDALGNTVTYTYDARGNILTETDALGNTTTYTNDSRGNVLSKVDARGFTTTYTYDDNNNLLSETDALGNTVTHTYTSFNKVRTLTDKRGYVTEFVYDAFGQHVETIYPDGRIESMAYDVNGNLRREVDADGRATVRQYDSENRLITVEYADGSIESHEYDPRGNRTATIDALGYRTEYEYDSAGRIVLERDALGNEIVHTYDPVGNRIATIDALGYETGFEYDVYNRRAVTTYPDGSVSSQTSDAAGRKVDETDQAGLTTQFEYDPLDRIVRIIDALGGETTYAYDAAGNKISQTDPNGNTTSWTYDELNRLESKTLPGGQSETFIYDESGNVIVHTDFNGDATTFEHSACCGRMISKTFPDGATVAYTYTGTGKDETVTDSRGETLYVYDLRDRLVSVTDPEGNTLSYTYDDNGNRTSVTTPDGTTEYAFDALRRLTEVTDPDGGVTIYQYDNAGNQISLTYPNGTITEYTFDTLNRLTLIETSSSTGGVISSYAYTLGPAGHRLQVIEHSGRTVDYTYDALYRLVEEDIVDAVLGSETISYTYDAFSNRLSKTDSTGTISYIYDANDRLISETGPLQTLTYTYDANGNTLTKSDGIDVTTYSYDYQNRLTGIQTAGSTISYNYDPDGIRIGSTVDGAVTNYLVDKNRNFAQVLEERDSSGALIVGYVYGEDLIRQQRSGLDHYYIYDGQMSVRQLIDAGETATDQYTYDGFGQIIDQSGTTENNYLYTGEQYDINAGAYYLRARYYTQETGRFLTADPYQGDMLAPVTLNKYLYAGANPVMHIDPSGNFFSLAGISISMAIRNNLRTSSGMRAYQAYKRVRRGLCVAGSVSMLNAHHAVPMFMGGQRKFHKTNNPKVWLPKNFHQEFHLLLHYMLRMAGMHGGYKSYEEVFKKNPATRAAAHQILILASRIFDKQCAKKIGFKITPRIKKQIKMGKWEF